MTSPPRVPGMPSALVVPKGSCEARDPAPESDRGGAPPGHLDARYPRVEILGVVAAAALAALLALAGAPTPLRLYPGLAAVLLLPGWSATMALFPRRGSLGGVERLSLALGLSVSIVAALALALNAIPGGLSSRAMIAGVSACTVLASAIAWLRSRDAPTTGLPRLTWTGGLWATTRPVAVGAWVMAASLLVASISLAIVVGVPGPESTEFGVVGAAGPLERYPEVIGAGPGAVDVAIVSHRRAVTTYRIVAQSQGRSLATGDPITLAPGATWQGTVEYPLAGGVAGAAPADQTIDLLLYEDGEHEPCCRLRLHMHADATPSRGGEPDGP